LLVLAGALGIGLIGGLGLGLLREQFDPIIRSSDQISEDIGLPVLVALPRPPRSRGWWLVRPGDSIDAPNDATSAEQAAVRRLRDTLAESLPMNETRLVLITSPDSISARSLVALDLARSAALDGERVLLIDGDPRQHRLTSSLSGAAAAGLREVLAGHVVLSNAVVSTPWQGVDLLTSGATAAPERQLRQLPGEAISGQLRAFDLVVVDGRPSDPLARGFNSIVDDVVIVVEAGVSKKDELRDMVRTLTASKLNVRGAVLVGTA
jgi:Mrp family chromosome partitioning ATPase